LAVGCAALAIAGCGGGSSGVKPAAYVRSMCSALGTWKNDVQQAGRQLQSSGASRASRAVAKQDYQQFVAALLAATERATNALRGAGTPAVKNGRRIASTLAGAFSTASHKLSQANAQAGSIPTSTASTFQLGASAVTTEIKSALEGIAAVSPGESPELRTAAAREPACRVLTG
jgi:hypothetical protein